MVVTPRHMTLKQFLAIPEEKPALEYVHGEVVQKVSPSLPHSAATYSFCALTNRFAHGKKLAWAFPELRGTYGGLSTVPDVAVYTWDRIPRDHTGRLATSVLTPPDIAVEIRSPDQTFESNLVRCLWYVANGVRVAIAIEPRQLAVVVFRPGVEPLTFQETGLLDLTDVIPGFSLDIGELLAPLSPDWLR